MGRFRSRPLFGHCPPGQPAALGELRRRGGLSTAEGAELLGEELGVVRHLLNDLSRSGVAAARGNTRARRYHYIG